MELPTQLTWRRLAVRAFDSDAMMLDAAIIAGIDLEQTARRLLENADADHLQVYNAERGCWAARPRPDTQFGVTRVRPTYGRSHVLVV